MALVAVGALDRVALVLAPERRVHLVAGGAQRGPVPGQEPGAVARVGVVAGRAAPLGERGVLDLALLPGGDLLVAGEAEVPARLDEQAGVRRCRGAGGSRRSGPRPPGRGRSRGRAAGRRRGSWRTGGRAARGAASCTGPRGGCGRRCTRRPRPGRAGRGPRGRRPGRGSSRQTSFWSISCPAGVLRLARGRPREQTGGEQWPRHPSSADGLTAHLPASRGCRRGTWCSLRRRRACGPRAAACPPSGRRAGSWHSRSQGRGGEAEVLLGELGASRRRGRPRQVVEHRGQQEPGVRRSSWAPWQVRQPSSPSAGGWTTSVSSCVADVPSWQVTHSGRTGASRKWAVALAWGWWHSVQRSVAGGVERAAGGRHLAGRRGSCGTARPPAR